MYKIEYWQAGINGAHTENFKTQKEARKAASELMNENAADYRKAGYKRIGRIYGDKYPYVKWVHPVFGVDFSLVLQKI